jgi:hypothetical protein
MTLVQRIVAEVDCFILSLLLSLWKRRINLFDKRISIIEQFSAFCEREHESAIPVCQLMPLSIKAVNVTAAARQNSHARCQLVLANNSTKEKKKEALAWLNK